MTQTSMTTRSRESKKNAAIAAIAVSLARKNNDIMFGKLKKYRKMWKATKELVLRKYQSKALQEWSKQQSQSSNGGGVKTNK